MTIETYKVTDRQSWLQWRKQDVTASVGAALFGDDVHPYMTPYQLFALKAGLIEEDPQETPAMKRGRLLEPVGLQLMREERPDWKIWDAGEYLRDTEFRVGASPDWYAECFDRVGRGIVQFKSVGRFAFDKGWIVDHQLRLPLWIAVQASIEAALTGAAWAVVAAMVLGDGGLDLHVIDVPLRSNEKLMEHMRAAATDFWKRVAEKRPYPPNYGRDAALVADLYMSGRDESAIKAFTDQELKDVLPIVAKRAEYKAIESSGNAAEKDRKKLDAELIHLLGNSAAGRLPNGTIVQAKVVQRKGFTTDATQYVQLSIK